MARGWWLLTAAAAVLGALRPAALPIAPLLLAVALAVVRGRPALACLCVGLLVSSASARAWAGLDGVVAGPVAGEVVLLTDPEPGAGGRRADARLGGRRVELRARGRAAVHLEDLLVGDRVTVRGDLVPAPADAPWLVPRHVGGIVTVHRIEGVAPAGPPHALANGLRRVLARGAAPLDETHRALFAGLVVGDDRAQPPALTDAFRGAGLTHLLAVSGQNVAFVLVLLGPVARRLRLWPRLLVTLAVVGGFGLMTRFEPSVLRAGAMAAIALTTTTVGRPVHRLQVLALAVTGLLLVDPLLVHAVGFRLSVLAAMAIVVLAPPIAAALPGPAVAREALAVTIAAQLGVAPVLLATFGPIPVASLPANLLAVPAAGLVMAWGCTGGMVAGVLGGAAAEVLHLPTRVLLGWIEGVATRAAAAPLGELRTAHVLVAALALAVAVAARHHGAGRRARRVALAVAAGVVVAAVLPAHAPPPLRSSLGPGLVRWHWQDTELIVVGGGGWRARPAAGPTLEALRRAGVRAIDLLVLADPGGDEHAAVVAALRTAHPVGSLLAAADVPATGTELRIGHLTVTLAPGRDRLVVDARPVAEP